MVFIKTFSNILDLDYSYFRVWLYATGKELSDAFIQASMISFHKDSWMKCIGLSLEWKLLHKIALKLSTIVVSKKSNSISSVSKGVSCSGFPAVVSWQVFNDRISLPIWMLESSEFICWLMGVFWSGITICIGVSNSEIQNTAVQAQHVSWPSFSDFVKNIQPVFDVWGH